MERSGERRDKTAKLERKIDIGHALQTLIASGHSLVDILERQQPGLPYHGWTLRQVYYFTDRCLDLKKMHKKEFMLDAHLVLQAILNKKAFKDFKKRLEQLDK